MLGTDEGKTRGRGNLNDYEGKITGCPRRIVGKAKHFIGGNEKHSDIREIYDVKERPYLHRHPLEDYSKPRRKFTFTPENMREFGRRGLDTHGIAKEVGMSEGRVRYYLQFVSLREAYESGKKLA